MTIGLPDWLKQAITKKERTSLFLGMKGIPAATAQDWARCESNARKRDDKRDYPTLIEA